MSKITYENKVALNENPSIADINKVKDTDMNEIKDIVNGNDNQLVIDTIEPEDLDNLRIWVNPDEPLQNVGTEVVNSLDGNETNMAPSVNAVKQALENIDVSSQITLNAGYTKSIRFAIKQNDIINLNMVIDFSAVTVVNNQIGTHTFNLKKDCVLPLFVYGDGYAGGFGSITFYKDGRIYLVAYSNSPIKQVTMNGILY